MNDGDAVMFSVRRYEERDLADCAACFHESFFDCPADGDDGIFLRDYAQVMIERSNFTFVAEAGDGRAAGFICGRYSADFDGRAARTYMAKKHRGVWCRAFLKFALKRYRMSDAFGEQFDAFYAQLGERDAELIGGCDLELVALCSMRGYRGGVGTALLERFLDKAEADGVGTVRVFTNTLASYGFYERRGFRLVSSKPFGDGSGNSSLVYEYDLGERPVRRRSPIENLYRRSRDS